MDANLDSNSHPDPLARTPGDRGIVPTIATDSAASTLPEIAIDSAASTVFGPNNFTKITCAAGSLCTVDCSVADGIASSAHHCFNCKKKIHSALTCGEWLSDIIESGKFTYKSLLSSAGKSAVSDPYFEPERLTLCYMCETNLENEFDNAVQATANEVQIIIPSANDPLQPPRKVDWKAMNYIVAWENIVVSAGDTNKCERRKNSGMSRLQGLLVDDVVIDTCTITLDDLRKIAAKFGIAKTRLMKKKLCPTRLCSSVEGKSK